MEIPNHELKQLEYTLLRELRQEKNELGLEIIKLKGEIGVLRAIIEGRAAGEDMADRIAYKFAVYGMFSILFIVLIFAAIEKYN